MVGIFIPVDAALHREELLEGPAPLAWIEPRGVEIREEAEHGILHGANDALVDGNSNQSRRETFGR